MIVSISYNHDRRSSVTDLMTRKTERWCRARTLKKNLSRSHDLQLTRRGPFAISCGFRLMVLLGIGRITFAVLVDP